MANYGTSIKMVKNESNASTDLLHDQHLEQVGVPSNVLLLKYGPRAVNPAGVSVP